MKIDESNFYYVAETSRELLCILENDGTFIYISPSCKTILEFSTNELTGSNYFDLIHPEDRNLMESELKLYLNNSGETNQVEYRIKKKNGEYIWFESSITGLKDEFGIINNLQMMSRDISKKINTEEELHRSEQKYKSLISALDEGILLIDEKGIVISTNKSASIILGLAEDEIVGSLSFEFHFNIIYEDGGSYPEEKLPSLVTLRTGVSQRNKIMGVQFASTEIKWLSVNTKPVYFKNLKRPAGVALTFLDITNRKKIENEIKAYVTQLKDKKDKLEENTSKLQLINEKLKISERKLMELNANKDKFLSIIGHDLRSPFDALLGYSEIIHSELEDLTNEELVTYSDYINKAARHLLDLLNNLLDWSNIQTGRLTPKIQTIDLKEKAEIIVTLLKGKLNTKNITVVQDIDEHIKVSADDTMLNSILQNLISNAIKFTPQDGEIKIVASDDAKGTNISISDSGIGMNEEQIQSLFKIDKNISRPGTAKEKGTGLGLIITKELITLCKGTIKVNSETGKGSTFILTLPLSKENSSV
jgi:PAS domain S-box-containing protein